MLLNFWPSAIRAGIISVITMGFLLGCSKQEDVAVDIVRPVKLFKIESGHNKDIRRFPAQVYSAKESMISFRIPGELVELPVNNADDVKEGQLLARMDDRDIRSELELRQADFDLAEINYQRISALHKKKVVSQSELDTASANLKSARASLQLAQDRLAYTTLTAPFDGRVARLDVENHQYVRNQQTILILQNSEALEVSIQMPESILTSVPPEQVNEGYQPTVTFNGIPGKTFLVTYKEHSTTVTPGTQSYKVTFTLPVPEDVIVYPGMGATVAIDFARLIERENAPDAFIVPLTAVLVDDTTGKQQSWVYKQEAGVVQPVAVQVGQITQDGITVLSGLKPGDQIVTAGLTRLRKGMKVKPLTRERGL